MERRDFLRAALRFFFASLVLGGSAMLAVVNPPPTEPKKLRYVYATDEDDLPKQGVRSVTYRYVHDDRTVMNRAYCAVTEKGITFFSPICTHLGCFINWDHNRNEFICPCHKGKYRITGEVIAGPPPRPLTNMPHLSRNGKLFIGIMI